MSVSESTLMQNSSSPLYEQLMVKLRERIASGAYSAHGRIPSEQELCDIYGVSRVTVRKALAELASEGLLERRQGKGTFVRVTRIRRDLRQIHSFQETCRQLGVKASAKVLRSGMVPPDDEDVAVGLSETGGQVVEIVRLRMADHVPVMLEENRFHAEYQWLLEEELTASLYELLSARGVEADQASHEISLCYASQFEGPLLHVEPGAALLQLNEVIYDQRGRLLHTSRQKILGDKFTFRI